MISASLKKMFLVVILSGMTSMVFADDAPVYDVDNYPPQFDGQSDATNAAPPPSADEQAATAPPAAHISSSAAASAPALPQAVPLSTEQRLARAEQQITNLQHVDSVSRLNTLQTEVQTLRGQVEDLTHQLQQMQTQQRAMYSDLDKRLGNKSAVEKTLPEIVDKKPVKSAVKVKLKEPAAKPVSPPAQSVSATPDISSAKPLVAGSPSAAQPDVAEEQQIYQTAYDLIKAKKYNEAISALQNMLQKYPTGQFAANAHYWLGELYGLLGKNEQSAVEFAKVVKDYPDSPKVSDAQLKLGLSYAAQLRWSEAKSAFKKVINHYPGTASSHLASEQLKQIRVAGH